MKKWIFLMALILLAATVSTAALAQDTGQPAGGSSDGPVKLTTAKQSAFLTLDLQAGFALDPFFVSVNGGGNVDASTLDAGCTGYINDKPVVTLNWSGQVDMAYIFFYSDHDPTLVIETPDGSYLCGDDAYDNLLDPLVAIEEPPQGQYNIWVGSVDEGQLIPGVLVITTKSQFNVGSFNLGSFVKRPSLSRNRIPLEQQLPEASRLRAAFATALKARVDAAPVLDAKTQVLTKTLTVSGTNPAFMLPVAVNSPATLCNGLVGDGADALFNLTRKTAVLNVFFEGEADSTLVVVGPDGAAYCIDNSSDGGDLNPFISIANPPQGIYGVGIGRFDLDAPVTGTLTIDASGKLQPAVLAPAQP